jgi:hypothetical protein
LTELLGDVLDTVVELGELDTDVPLFPLVIPNSSYTFPSGFGVGIRLVVGPISPTGKDGIGVAMHVEPVRQEGLVI